MPFTLLFANPRIPRNKIFAKQSADLSELRTLSDSLQTDTDSLYKRLSGIALSSGRLSPSFSPSRSHYTAGVGNDVNNIIVTPSTNDSAAVITVNGSIVRAGNSTLPITLNAGANKITIAVTHAGDTTSRRYYLTVTRALSSNANLLALLPGNGVLSPAFNADTLAYTDTVSNKTTSITLTTTVADTTARVAVNRTPVISGTASGPITLNVGLNTIPIIVKAQDSTPKQYTVTVKRAKSCNARLSGITFSAGTLLPSFNRDTLAYTDTVSNSTASVTITPTSADSTATITVDGAAVTSGTASAAIALNTGRNVLTVKVTAQDSITTRSYNITVIRTISSNANLSALSLSQGNLSPVFNSDTLVYTDTVNNKISSITLTPVVADTTARAMVNGNPILSGSASGAIVLNVGQNIITIAVIAQDSTLKQYSINVIRAKSCDAKLSGIGLSAGTLSPVFNADTLAYADSVTNNITSITLTPIAADSTATITINGIPVLSGTASSAIVLNVGQNNLTVTVTAQNGTTIRSYIITVIRAASSDATLSGIALSQGQLSPAFESDSTNYTANVNVVKKDHAVFTIGDSITARGRYESTLDSLLSFQYNVVNEGVPGDQTPNMLNRYKTVLDAAPDYLIVLDGTNDIGAGVNATTVETNLQTAFDEAHAAGIKVIALTITPCKGSGTWTLAHQAVIDSVNRWILHTARVDYAIDMYTVLVDPHNPYQILPFYDSGDHIHPSVPGQDLMASVIFNAVPFAPNAGIDLANAARSAVTITPTTSDTTATVTVNGLATVSGQPSAPVALAQGVNNIITSVTAGDGKTQKTYSLALTAKPSNDANLAYLYTTVGQLTATPFFSRDSTNYTTISPYNTTTTQIRATTEDVNATVKVNGTTVLSGVYSPVINLAVGLNTISVVVTAADGVTTKTYTLIINRTATSNANLSNLTLSNGAVLTPAFASGTPDYVTHILNSNQSIQLTPTTADPNAIVKVNFRVVKSGTASQLVGLPKTQDTIPIVVESADGTIFQSYRVIVVLVSVNANLASLKTDNAILSPAFAPMTRNYTSTVENAITTVSITPTTGDPLATITINGKATPEGVSSASLPLAVGSNVFTIVVTSHYNLVTQTYTIKIARKSNNANLTVLHPSNGTLSPAFNLATTSYTASVTNAVSAITITPKTQDSTAFVTVFGFLVPSNTPSPAINLGIGNTVINTVVTAQDGTKKTYVLTVTRAQSSNTKLAGLSVSADALSPAFAPSVFTYTDTVAISQSTVTVKPIAAESTQRITVNGIAVLSGANSGSINLNTGTNTINVAVTAQDGAVNTYTINVIRPVLIDVNLAGLHTSNGTLSPVFSATNTAYTTTVTTTISAITVTPKAEAANATIKVNGVSVISSSASQSIPLNYGLNTIAITLKAPDSTTVKTYTITVTRQFSSNANLAALTPNTGVLTPVFTAATTNYSSTVGNAVSSITLTPTTADGLASIMVNGIPAASGAGSTVPLQVGLNIINVLVTAPDGITTKIYTVAVTRTPLTNDNLALLRISNGILSPVFNTATTGYTDVVTNVISAVTVTPTTADTTAAIKINGVVVKSKTTSPPILLNIGTNVINIVVTAQDTTVVKTYSITVTRTPLTNANLSALHLSKGTLAPAFAAGTMSYTATVANAVSSVTVSPIVADTTATIKVNGMSVASRGTSPAINLKPGNNIINVVVTAQDTTVVKTYTITVTRTEVINPDLSALHISNGVLSPVFAAATTNYNATVTNPVSVVSITPTPADSLATITVNGMPVASKSSSNVHLYPGANTINIVVTAEDGITTKTYTLTVMRTEIVNADLSVLHSSNGTLSPVFAAATTNYSATVTNPVSAITLTVSAADSLATITVNGTMVASRSAAVNLPLKAGLNTIVIVVTAEDGITTKTYTLNITRVPLTNATLSAFHPSNGTLSPSFQPATLNYTASVNTALTSMTVTPTAADTTAIIRVNGIIVASGKASQVIPLSVGQNVINTVVTAQDTTVIKTYTLKVTRPAPPGSTLNVGLQQPADSANITTDNIVVHQAVSPNGDGINDVLMIAGIGSYPDNKLQLMDQTGNLVYEVKGYDNSAKVFDGHGKNGQLLLQGTYFYKLEYTANGHAKQKTGYIVLKY